MSRILGPLHDLQPALRWCLSAGLFQSNSLPPTPGQVSNELDAILREDLAAIALTATDGDKELADLPVNRFLRQWTLSAQMQSMAAEAAGSKFLVNLAESGARFAVIKGPSLSRLYPPKWQKPYKDIDIVVPPKQFGLIVKQSLSTNYEYSPRSVPQWRWFDTLCREGINLHGASGGNIDIHHHIPPWAFSSSLRSTDIIDRSTPWTFLGQDTPAASEEDQVTIAGLHILNDLWKGKVGVSSWRDVIFLIQKLGMNSAADAFNAVGLAWLFGLIHDELCREFPHTNFGEGASREPHLPAIIRWRLKAIGWYGSTNLSRNRLTWAARLPLANGIAYLAGTAFPSATYVHERHGSRLKYLRSGLSETVEAQHGSDFRMITVDDKAAHDDNQEAPTD